MEDTVSSNAEGQSTESPKDCAAHSPLVELGGGERLGVAVALDDGFEHGVF